MQPRTECRTPTSHRNQQTFGKHLQQDSTLPQAYEPQDSHRSAALFDQHEHQREQKHGARDHRYDGDGEVEAIENDKDCGRAFATLRCARSQLAIGIRADTSRANDSASRGSVNLTLIAVTDSADRGSERSAVSDRRSER